MSRIVRLVPVIVFALLGVVLYSSRAQTAPNATLVCTSIAGNTTWTATNSPYEICNTAPITVQQNATLTIQPGVTVIFDGASYPFTVVGTIDALGTAAQPILFTGATKSAGSWRGLLVAGTGGVKAGLQLDNTTIEYGGAFTTAEIYADLADISINHSQIQTSLKNGLEITNNASFSIQNTGFTGNVQDAMTVHEPKIDLAMTGLAASGNGRNAVHIAGINTQMNGQRRWANPGIPYFIDGSVNNAAGDVLTIDPGSELDFNGGALNISGELLAQGTQTAAIVLSGATPVAGSWVGLVENGGAAQANVDLDYATIQYGGSDIGGANIEYYEWTPGRPSQHHPQQLEGWGRV